MFFKIKDEEMIDFSSNRLDMMQMSDEEINNKYVSGEVRIVTEQARYPLDSIVPMLDGGKYVLTPEYQRRHRWDQIKKSKLIESFIMNVPIPPVFLYETDYAYYEVMDGLQRLTAIRDFYKNGYELQGLELWPELNGRTYDRLPEKIRQGIDRRYVSSIILLQESARSPEEALFMKQLVFERINSGGVKLEAQETRNALHNGKMNLLCIELSQNIYFRRLFGIPYVNVNHIPDMNSNLSVCEDQLDGELDKNALFNDMTDVELVLRFFAFRNIDGYARNTLKLFLDEYLKHANSFSEKLLNELKQIFEEVIKFAYELLGDDAFKLYRKRYSKSGESWYWYNRPTTTVYDPIMQILSQLLKHKNELIRKKKEIHSELETMYKEKYFIFEGRNTNKNNVEERYKTYKEFFSKFIDGGIENEKYSLSI